MNLYEETQMLLNQYGLRANKKLGQNFLINEEIIDEIVEKSCITKDDTILEIGPGSGIISTFLSRIISFRVFLHLLYRIYHFAHKKQLQEHIHNHYKTKSIHLPLVYIHPKI